MRVGVGQSGSGQVRRRGDSEEEAWRALGEDAEDGDREGEDEEEEEDAGEDVKDDADDGEGRK